MSQKNRLPLEPTLGDLVDAFGVYDVVRALAGVVHNRVGRQPESDRFVWRQAAAAVDRAVETIEKIGRRYG